MDSLHAIELVPDASAAEIMWDTWRRLADRGLPSMLDQGVSPHVTAIAVPSLTDAEAALASTLLEPLLPVRAGLAGVAFFGGRLLTAVQVVDVPDDLAIAVARLRKGTTGHQHPGWLPHVTLARGVDPQLVSEIVAAVKGSDGFTLTALRHGSPTS